MSQQCYSCGCQSPYGTPVGHFSGCAVLADDKRAALAAPAGCVVDDDNESTEADAVHQRRRAGRAVSEQADPAPAVAGEVLAWAQIEEGKLVALAFSESEVTGCTVPLCDARIVAAKDAEIARLRVAHDVVDAAARRVRQRAEALAGELRECLAYFEGRENMGDEPNEETLLASGLRALLTGQATPEGAS